MISPHLLLFVLQLVHFCLREVGLPAVLVPAEGPIPLGFDPMAEGVRSQSLNNMSFVYAAIVLCDGREVGKEKRDILIPFLIDNCLQLKKIFVDFEGGPLLQVIEPGRMRSGSGLLQKGSDVQDGLVGVDFDKLQDRVGEDNAHQNSVLFLNCVELGLQTGPVVVEEPQELVGPNYFAMQIHPMVEAPRYSSKLS